MDGVIVIRRFFVVLAKWQSPSVSQVDDHLLFVPRYLVMRTVPPKAVMSSRLSHPRELSHGGEVSHLVIGSLTNSYRIS